REHLDGDVAAELRIARAIDLAHAAGADLRGDLIGSEAGSLAQRHAASLTSRTLVKTRRVTARWYAAPNIHESRLRHPFRELSDPRAAWRGGHGRGLPRIRHEARASGRGEGAAVGGRARPGAAPAPPAR